MFYPAFVCLSLCLSVCFLFASSRENYLSDLRENFSRDVSLGKEVPVNF